MLDLKSFLFFFLSWSQEEKEYLTLEDTVLGFAIDEFIVGENRIYHRRRQMS